MTSTCQVCTHSQRHLIDAALADDEVTLGAVASEYGVTIGELAQHWTCCTLQLTPETDKQAERKARADAQRDAVGAFDAGALDALLDAVLQPQSTASRSQTKGGT